MGKGRRRAMNKSVKSTCLSVEGAKLPAISRIRVKNLALIYYLCSGGFDEYN